MTIKYMCRIPIKCSLCIPQYVLLDIGDKLTYNYIHSLHHTKYTDDMVHTSQKCTKLIYTLKMNRSSHTHLYISHKLSAHHNISSCTVMFFSVIVYWTSVLILVC